MRARPKPSGTPISVLSAAAVIASSVLLESNTRWRASSTSRLAGALPTDATSMEKSGITPVTTNTETAPPMISARLSGNLTINRSESENGGQPRGDVLDTARRLVVVERHRLERRDRRHVLRPVHALMQGNLDGVGLRQHPLDLGRQRIVDQLVAFVGTRRATNQGDHVGHHGHADPVPVRQYHADRLARFQRDV